MGGCGCAEAGTEDGMNLISEDWKNNDLTIDK
jgi:hypothetical protein